MKNLNLFYPVAGFAALGSMMSSCGQQKAEVKKAYKVAKRELDKIRKQQSAWDQEMKPSEKRYLVIRANRPEQIKERSIHERLEEKKREAAHQQRKERKRNYNRDCL